MHSNESSEIEGYGKLKEDPYTMCPFYRKENAIEIRCKGIIGQQTTSTFLNKQQKLEYKANFCNCMCFKGCPLYQSLSSEEQT